MADAATIEQAQHRAQVRRLQELVVRLQAGHSAVPDHLQAEFDVALAAFPFGSLPEDKEAARG